MSATLITEMTIKVRIVDELYDTDMERENIERAESIVGYRLFDENGEVTQEAKYGHLDGIFGEIKTALDKEGIDIVDWDCNKIELVR